MNASIWVSVFGIFPILLVMAPKTVTIPKGTEVLLVFDQQLSLKTASAGDKVALHVASDVTVDGRTVIPAGTKANATVSNVEKRKHFGINAKLRLAFDPIKSVSGQMVPIEPRDKGKYTGSRTDKAGMAAGGGALLLGPVGLVGGYFVVGKPVNIHVGDRALTQVASDTTVNIR